MAAAHHNLPGPLVQQILETRPPLAEQIRLDSQNREFTEQGWEPVYSASPHARIVVIVRHLGVPRRRAVSRGMTRAA